MVEAVRIIRTRNDVIGRFGCARRRLTPSVAGDDEADGEAHDEPDDEEDSNVGEEKRRRRTASLQQRRRRATANSDGDSGD